MIFTRNLNQEYININFNKNLQIKVIKVSCMHYGFNKEFNPREINKEILHSSPYQQEIEVEDVKIQQEILKKTII